MKTLKTLSAFLLLSYCYEKEWLILKKMLGGKVDKAIMSQQKSKRVEVLTKGHVAEVQLSEVTVDIHKSEYIRSLFTKKISAECETQ